MAWELGVSMTIREWVSELSEGNPARAVLAGLLVFAVCGYAIVRALTNRSLRTRMKSGRSVGLD